MKSLTTLFCIAIITVLSGCSGAYTVRQANGEAPEKIRSVAFSPQDGNSEEVTGYITDALLSQGVTVAPPVPQGVRKANGPDAVISYLDVWRWDLSTYMKSINISLYSARTGELLVNGRWEDSEMHGFQRGAAITQALIEQMFERLSTMPKQPLVTDKAPTVGTPEASSQQAQNRATAVKALPTSRYEYDARQTAKGTGCTPRDLVSVTGVGTPREEIVFACEANRTVTIVCNRNGCQ